MVADGLMLVWQQDIYNHYDDLERPVQLLCDEMYVGYFPVFIYFIHTNHSLTSPRHNFFYSTRTRLTMNKETQFVIIRFIAKSQSSNT